MVLLSENMELKTNPENEVEETVTQLYHGKEAIGRKLAFGTGEIVYNFPWMLVSSYLMFFLTDIALIPAIVVSVLFFGVRVFDAVNDPIIGILADKTRTKHGRYRPWLAVGGPLLLIITVLLFWAHPDWSESARIWYTCIIYILAVIVSTMWNIPFGGLHASITPYSTERASFASYRILFSSVASAIAAGAFLPLVNKFGGSEGDLVNGYLMATLIICAFALPFIFTTILGTKEVVQPPKMTLKKDFKSFITVLTKNPPWIIVIFGFFVYGFMMYGRMTVAIYYFTYVWNDAGLFTIFVLFNGIITGVAAYFGVYFLKVFKSKRNTIIFGLAGNAIFSLIVFLLSPEMVAPMVVVTLLYISAFFNGIITCMLYAMIPDTVEYGQWKSGVRADGLIYSGTTFMLKFGGAISPALLGVLLGVVGYIPNGVQPESSLLLMNVMMNLVPAILCAVGFVLFFFYKLDEGFHNKILADLMKEEKI